MKRADEEDRALLKEQHAVYKKDQGLVIYNIKDEIDSVLNNPNFIA